MKGKKSYCLAGNYDQYQDFLYKYNYKKENVQYIKSSCEINFLDEIDVYYYGTYLERKDFPDIDEIVKLKRLNVIYSS